MNNSWKMTIQTLWFLSYVGIGLALVVGNHLTSPISNSQNQDHPHDKLPNLNPVTNNLHLRAHQYDGSRRDSVHDWLVYDGQLSNTPSSPIENGHSIRRYENVLFEELGSPPVEALQTHHALSREPFPFVYEDALFQEHHTRKRTGSFKHSKKVVGLPPLVYGSPEEETPPGQSDPGERDNLEELFRQNMAMLENSGGLPFEPPDSSHKPQGGGIGLSPLIFETDKPPGKRNQPVPGHHTDSKGSSAQQIPVPPGGAAIASQFMLRSARGNRQYDVPQIECPSSEDGMERFACPTPDRMGRYRCIDDHVLCDGFIDCPTGEDEDRQSCMFYKTTKAHLDVLADALLRWARGR